MSVATVDEVPETPAARRGLRERFLFPLILIGISTLFALVVAEIALRIMGLGFGHSPLLPDPVFHHVHPRDYHFRLTTPTTKEIVDHDVYYDANGEVADPNGPHVPASPKYRVALLGDSFMEGNQVLWAEAIGGRLTLSGGDTTQVRNFGVSSYSPIFYRLQWKKDVADFHPTHVFALMYNNDVRDDTVYGKLAKRDAAGKVIAVPGPSNALIPRLMRKSYVLRFAEMMRLKLTWATIHRGRLQRIVGGEVEENPVIPPATAEYMRDLARDVEASGAKFVLLAVPSKYRMYNPAAESGPEYSDRWRAWAAQNGVTFVDLVAPFKATKGGGKQLFFVHDSHWNAGGHALAAETIRANYPELFGARPSRPQ